MNAGCENIWDFSMKNDLKQDTGHFDQTRDFEAEVALFRGCVLSTIESKMVQINLLFTLYSHLSHSLQLFF